MNKRPGSETEQILEGKIFAVLSYLSILCIIPLVLSARGGSAFGGKNENSFVLRHGKQGLVIFLGEVAVFIIHIVLGDWILRLGIFVFGVISFIGIVAALKGRHIELPVVSGIAQKITL